MTHRPIARLLVANRGEIAVRVMRTARAMGIRTVAVYSDADVGAPHVAAADMAVRIGPAPARDSYLDGAAVLAAARASGADAIHPGYGFLSENADFAAATAAAGLVFVGPPPAAIRAMGSKSAAKALMDAAGVPLVPGYHGEDQDPARLAEEAERIGFPVLVKASAGGGGKGMKVARSAAELPDALASARREAAAAFGDDRLLIERYLTRPRHIEVQVFADSFGTTIHLHERDCSIQRRHQKVIEEAPAPGLRPDERARLGAAAVAAARAVGYVGAGTVEFVAEDGAFHFLEMNTRLQVEHPVTEAITGLDLVEWQIRIARGEALPLRQDAIPLEGHAIEARLYAEDPRRDFLPQTGTITHLRLPEGMPGIRVDAGVTAGGTVSRHYDPMIAKIVAHGATREEARLRLAAALGATEVAGLSCNRDFLLAIAGHPAFAAGDLDTGFIERHRSDLLPVAERPDAAVVAVAAWIAAARDVERFAAADPLSPWTVLAGFQPNLTARVDLPMTLDGTDLDISLTAQADDLLLACVVHFLDQKIAVSGRRFPDGGFEAEVTEWAPTPGSPRGDEGVSSDDAHPGPGLRRRLAGRVVGDGPGFTLFVGGAQHAVTIRDRWAAPSSGSSAAGHLRAPMPGAVVAVSVSPGETVTRGAVLVVVEAMKMEHAVLAPRDGVVAAVACAVGDVVAEGAELVTLEDVA